MRQQPVSKLPSEADSVEPLLQSLGLFEQVANTPPLDWRKMLRFQERQLAFDWAHMGNAEITLGQLIATLQGEVFLSPPRTGHLGNWSNIVKGRACTHDYNNLTCGRHRIGHALIFDFNQTESDTPGLGDWSYLPGSLVDRCERRPLELLTWDGRTFRRRGRSAPRFTPFTLTSFDGHLVPLVSLHRNACRRLEHFEFRFLSQTLLRQEGLIRRVLEVLLTYARSQEKPEAVLRRLFDRRVNLDGCVERVSMKLLGRGFRMADTCYAGLEDFIDHALLPLQAAASPDDFPAQVKDLPSHMPMMAPTLLTLLEAVLNTHYPDIDGPPPGSPRPCNPHLHWGGPAMGGYQPQLRGYFAEHARHLRKLFRPVIDEILEVEPVFFVLLPAAIFNLCPHEALSRDVVLMDRLMTAVSRKAGPLLGRPAEMCRCIEQTVSDWQIGARNELSPYIVNRIAPRPGVVCSLPHPIEGELALLPSFLRLTLQQASMTMGALKRVRWRSA